MKFQTTVITPLGTFESNVVEADLTRTQIEEVRCLYEECHKATSLSIQQGNNTYYFPAEVIRKSVIIFDVSE